MSTAIWPTVRARNQIRQLVARLRTWKVAVVPRQNADSAITPTDWGWLDKLDGFGEACVAAFIAAWRDGEPERTQE